MKRYTNIIARILHRVNILQRNNPLALKLFDKNAFKLVDISCKIFS